MINSMAKNKRDNIDSFNGIFTGTKVEPESIENLEPIKTKGRPKEIRETKKRISLAILPSLYDSVGKIAYVDRESISEIVSKLLEEYVNCNQEKIEEYDRIKK